MTRFVPALLLMIASCDASVRLGSIGSDSPAIQPADAATSTSNSDSDSAPKLDATSSTADAETFIDSGVDAPADAVVEAADSGDAGPLSTLATGMPGAEWIAIDATHITWTTSGRSGIGSDLNGHYVSAKDGSNRVDLKTEQGILRGVIIDGPDFDSLRWVSPVSLIERASATKSLNQITGTFHEGFGLAFDDTFLYAAVGTKVLRIEKNAEAGTPTLLLASFAKAVAMANDGDQLYVADQGINRVARVDKATGDIPWSHDIGGAINDVTTNPTRVYFAGGGRAGSVLKTGGGLDVFDLPGVTALAVDSSGIYYLTKTAVLHADIATPSVVTTLASGFVSLGRVVTDADAIYFTDSGGGSVYRLKK